MSIKIDKALDKLDDLNKINDDILDAIIDMDARQSEEIMQLIGTAFELHQGDMDEKLNALYADLKKTDDVNMKLKLSVPIINLLGLNLETEFDVKNWATKMYKEHGFKIFKLLGHL